MSDKDKTEKKNNNITNDKASLDTNVSSNSDTTDYQRKDVYGNLILKNNNKKLHKISFADKISRHGKFIDVIPVESYKELNKMIIDQEDIEEPIDKEAGSVGSGKCLLI